LERIPTPVEQTLGRDIPGAGRLRTSRENAAVTRPAPAAAVPLVLVPALGLAQGGFPPERWVWAGALAAWAAALAAVLADDAGALRAAWPWLAAAGAVLAWTLASALWSVDPDQSVLDARRTLAYTAAVLALLALARPGAPALVVATHAAITFVIVYALARYLVAGHRTTFEANLLSEPLGYANAVGVVAVLGSLLGAGLAAGTASRRGAAAAASTLPVLAAALELSGSSASWLALAFGLGVLVVLEPLRARLLRTLALAAVPCATAVVLAHESGLSAAGSPRVDGRLVAVACVAFGLAAAALVARTAEAPSRRRPLPAWLLSAAALAVLAVAFAVVVAYGAARRPRSLYYGVAWHREFLAHPLLGSGAGTFGSYWDRFGPVALWGGALDAHSLYLETLAELGPIGLLLLLVFLAYPLRAALVTRGRPYVAAAAAAYAAFVFHAGLDWDWEMPVVVVAGLACGAAVIAGALTAPARLPTRARAAVVGASLVLGGFSILGARSSTQPGSALEQREAPKGLSHVPRVRRGYDLP
jgi:hypothetical protein